MNTPLLNNIAFDIVKDKVMEDKVKEMTEEAQNNQPEDKIETEADRLKNEELPDLDEVDSDEERIMQKEMEKRKDLADRAIEKEKKKLLLKYGEYREIIETEFLDVMLKNQTVVCHFYHNEFERCKIMDKHLKDIAQLHPETFFVKINADKTPFFTTKLQIKVLPTVVLFKDGKAYDRIVGFEDLGIEDNFPTINLIKRLVKANVIKARNKAEKGEITISKVNKDDSDDGSDY